MGLLSRPIFGRRLDAPYIARLIQRQSEQPKLLILSDQDTVYYPRSDAVLAGRPSNWITAPIPADDQTALRPVVYKECHTRLGKRMNRIQAGESNRNLAANSSTAADLRFLERRTQAQV